MYAGHDMSSHEVVVRSLLEVLQEFEDAREGDRTVRLRTCTAPIFRFVMLDSKPLVLKLCCRGYRNTAIYLTSDVFINHFGLGVFDRPSPHVNGRSCSSTKQGT